MIYDGETLTLFTISQNDLLNLDCFAFGNITRCECGPKILHKVGVYRKQIILYSRIYNTYSSHRILSLDL